MTAARDRTHEIALAALLHDVGKFAQRAEALRSESDLDAYCPLDPKTGRRTHHHAAYSAAFIEQYLSWLAPPGVGDQNAMGFAGRHHRPGSVWDEIVAEADRLSSGMDRGASERFEVGTSYWDEQVLPARLPPIFALANGYLESDADLGRIGVGLSLRPLGVGDEEMIPCGDEARSETSASRDDYRRLWEGFTRDVSKLPRPARVDDPAFFRTAVPTMASLYEKWTSNIPAATDQKLLGVSLYDHSRAAAAIAAALYRALGGDDLVVSERSAEVRRRDVERFALVVGDVSGIQKHLYTLVSKGAARTLRGRSLWLQLLTDAIACRLLHVAGLPSTSLLFCGGGKLWILAHAGTEDALRDAADAIDLYLLNQYGGSLSFHLGVARLSGETLLEKGVGERWGAALGDVRRSATARLRRRLRAEFDALFTPFGGGGTRSRCGVCGDEIPEEDDAEAPCRNCAEQQCLGRKLPRSLAFERCVYVPGADDRIRPADAIFAGPIAVAYRLLPMEDARGGLHWFPPFSAGSGDVIRMSLDGTAFLPADATNDESRGYSFRFVGKNLPRGEDGELLTFDLLADRAVDQGVGSAVLGVLRLDVDDLGDLFREREPGSEGRGLPPGTASLSRVATLSRQLDLFFCGHVSWLLRSGGTHGPASRWSDRIQIVYSGGDDLFLVGAWNAALAFAADLKQRFARFTCNPRLTLSAGIALTAGSHPIASGAEQARALEEAAKRRGEGSAAPGGRKRAIGLFDERTVLSWDELEVARRWVAALAQEIEKGRLSRGVLFRLKDVAEAYGSLASAPGVTRTVSLEAIAAGLHRGRWCWLADYTLPRAWSVRDPCPEWLRHPSEHLSRPDFGGASGERPVITYLGGIARWAELATRRGGVR
jgi:CRISPR-associated protein Csm1